MSAATSFRDPAGFCIALNGHVLRVVAPDHVAQVEEFLHSECGRKFTAAGTLIPTRLLTKAEVSEWLHSPDLTRAVNGRGIGAVFEHERIEFPSFSCEWSPEMLYAAGELTLDLALDALRSGYSLKDATPHNVLFRGSKPVFVDVLSFEPRIPGESIWKPYAQFVRTFLLPLLANKYLGMSLAEIFTTRRDGLEPEELFTRCSWLQKLRPPFLTLITLPKLLAGKGWEGAVPPAPGSSHAKEGRGGTRPSRDAVNDEKALFILEAQLKGLRSNLRSLKPADRTRTRWSKYMDTHNYDAGAFAAKEAFVRAALAEFKPQKVLDVGANTGHFSRMAAVLGAQVVGIDSDPNCAGECFRRARSESASVLPLVVDMARPTPALGWRNGECASFLDRARGQFDTVLMLAFVHHLLVTEGVPLSEIIDLGAELTKSLLLIEFVPVEDPMFQRLLRGRDALFAQYNREVFEQACQRHFQIVRSTELPNVKRWLYLLKKK
jgi:SAM-dependent methyltransferase